jgi:drug/metabolite transporter (DMT)-like permease
MPSYLYALICVTALSIGQVLFKAAAIASKESANFITVKSITYLAAAMFIYAGASLLWVWVLRSEDLGRIYPIMALAFVLVPIASHLFFGEKFLPGYMFGTAMIIVGVIVTTRH